MLGLRELICGGVATVQDNSAKHHIASQRAQHILACQRRRFSCLPEVAGFERKGKRLRKYYQVLFLFGVCVIVKYMSFHCHYPSYIGRVCRSVNNPVYNVGRVLLLLLHLFNGLFSRTTLVGRHQKGKPFWIYWSKRWWGGSGISWTICKPFAPSCRQMTMSVAHHSVFAGRMPFLPPISAHWLW